MAKYSPPKGCMWTVSISTSTGGSERYVLELRKKFLGIIPGKILHARHLAPVGSSETELQVAVDRVASSILKETFQVGIREIKEMLR